MLIVRRAKSLGNIFMLNPAGVIIFFLPLCFLAAGRIYKLRRPSSKHLATITTYDSLNPTCDWGFPQINTTFADGETDVTEAEDRNASASDTTKPSGDTVVSKPFVPNFGHWKFQPLVPTKVKFLCNPQTTYVCVQKFRCHPE